MISIQSLPLTTNIKTKQILKKSISASRALANLNIIINSLVLQEAKSSKLNFNCGEFATIVKDDSIKMQLGEVLLWRK